MNRTLPVLAAFFLFSGMPGLPAAKAPLSAEKLKKQASHIVTGEVVAVSSADQESKIETGYGSHVDRIFTIRVEVKSVVKGTGVTAGQEIVVEAWKPVRRVPLMPGLQGHESIPTKGDAVTVYLKKDAGGKVFKPLLPNGIIIHERKKPADETKE